MLDQPGRTDLIIDKERRMALVRAARRVLALMITTSLFSLGLIYQAQAQTAVIGLDPTFDQDGKRTTDFFGQDDQANAVALQSDGKLVVVGTAQTNLDRRFAVARYNPNGSLDATFGSGGKLTTDFPQPFVEANAVALQPDGKIVVAGSAGGNFALVRYNPDGKLDHSFGGDGRVITDYSSYVHFAVHINTSEARAVALQPDGKIVAAGWVNLDNGNGQIALARYNPNGQLDTSFDSDGKVMTNLGSNGAEANGIAIQPNGKIVVAGLLSGSHRTDSVLARYNRNGSLDTSFDSDGKRVENFYNSDEGAWAVALQPDGKIVTVGIATNPPSLGGFAVRRYNPDGSRDTTFGSDGNVLTDFFNQGAWARAVVIQPDGKIVVAGWAFKDLSLGFALARYQTDGTLDTSFDSDGRLTTNFSCARAFATGLALQPDGKIVAAGSTTAINEALDFAIARYSLSEPPATPGLLSLTLNDGNVGGCQTTTGVVTLNAPAPPEGITVSLTDTDAAVSVPASITVPAGETTACFQVDTTTVSAARGVSITARLGTVTKRVSMKVRPIGVQAIGLHSSVVREFETVAGTVTLECPAPVGGVVVTLSSSNPAVASPTVGQLIIPAGEMTGTFTVRAGDVTSRRSVQIRATLNGTSRAFPLIVYN